MPSVRDELEGFIAGRVKAERVVEAVAAAYYGEQGARSKEHLRPLLEVIERAHPGVVQLTGTVDRPGFSVRVSERPFPRDHEGALREAAVVFLGQPGSSAPRSVLRAPGIFSRLYSAVRRLFTASA